MRCMIHTEHSIHVNQYVGYLPGIIPKRGRKQTKTTNDQKNQAIPLIFAAPTGIRGPRTDSAGNERAHHVLVKLTECTRSGRQRFGKGISKDRDPFPPIEI